MIYVNYFLSKNTITNIRNHKKIHQFSLPRRTLFMEYSFHLNNHLVTGYYHASGVYCLITKEGEWYSLSPSFLQFYNLEIIPDNYKPTNFIVYKGT